MKSITMKTSAAILLGLCLAMPGAPVAAQQQQDMAQQPGAVEDRSDFDWGWLGLLGLAGLLGLMRRDRDHRDVRERHTATTGSATTH